MARLALFVTAEQADVRALAAPMHAGVDLLILGDSGDPQRDAATLREFREQWGRTQMLLGTANPEAGEIAAADVVHLAKPHWWSAPPKRPHEWSVLGRTLRDARTVRGAGERYDYFVIGPDVAPDSRVVAAAVEAQPCFDPDATAWFATAAPGQAEAFVEVGVRRLALGPEALAEPDPASRIAEAAAVLKRTWDADPKVKAYRFGAFRN